jgi:hypothetical protein
MLAERRCEFHGERSETGGAEVGVEPVPFLSKLKTFCQQNDLVPNVAGTSGR